MAKKKYEYCLCLWAFHRTCTEHTSVWLLRSRKSATLSVLAPDLRKLSEFCWSLLLIFLRAYKHTAAVLRRRKKLFKPVIAATHKIEYSTFFHSCGIQCLRGSVIQLTEQGAAPETDYFLWTNVTKKEHFTNRLGMCPHLRRLAGSSMILFHRTVLLRGQKNYCGINFLAEIAVACFE